jgi:GNAT superfamily N-acetyltransferase
VIAVRVMRASELERIGEVDRSEHVTQEYVWRDGVLETRNVSICAAPWSATGDGEHSIRGKVAAWQPILGRGGTLLGAFDAEILAGFAIHRPRLGEEMSNLAALFVGRSHRRRGIGSLLVAEVVRLARADGARRLYVSATPSVPTVDFYRSLGFRPADEPDEALFALEPDDIHMILGL